MFVRLLKKDFTEKGKGSRWRCEYTRQFSEGRGGRKYSVTKSEETYSQHWITFTKSLNFWDRHLLTNYLTSLWPRQMQAKYEKRGKHLLSCTSWTQDKWLISNVQNIYCLLIHYLSRETKNRKRFNKLKLKN